MKKIYKYPLLSGLNTELNLPIGAQFLSLQVQDLIPTVWFETNPEQPVKQTEILCFGTGWILPENLNHTHKYLGTIILEYNSLVWHYYIER